MFYALGDITFGQEEEQSEAATKNGGMVLAADEGSGAVVAMSAIAEEDFGDYGISGERRVGGTVNGDDRPRRRNIYHGDLVGSVGECGKRMGKRQDGHGLRDRHADGGL